MNERSAISGSCANESCDDELVCSIQMRDERALVALIQRYGGQVHTICKIICEDELEANAVVSDVFWEFWRNSDLFSKQRGSLRSYLMTMARSRSIDRKRSMVSRARRHTEYVDATLTSTLANSIAQTPDGQVLHDENAMQVQQAMCQLSDLQRQLLQLTFFQGMSHREVASSAKLPLGTVKTHIRKGLLRLKSLLVEYRAGE